MNQLDRTRPLYALQTDMETDVCIVGGGIAGIMTAYQILKNTKSRVTILEAFQIANGATGHNAGQLVDEMERSTVSMVQEYGLPITVEALRSIKTGWLLLEEIMHDAELTVPYSTFEGYDILATKDQIHARLADISLAEEGGLSSKIMYISKEHVEGLEIPDQYARFYELISHDSILALSQTKNPDYLAAIPLRKGCLNSAVLTEQLTTYLQNTYGIARFQVFEKTPVSEIVLNKENAVITTSLEKTVNAKTIILCTNGFENFKIREHDESINYDFHKNVKGEVGYMLGITEEINSSPSALSYYDPSYDTHLAQLLDLKVDIERDVAYGPQYVYTTRRPYDLGHEEPKNLFCIGGKGIVIEDSSQYGRDHVYHPDIKAEYERFIEHNFESRDDEPNHKEFMWHGLMGYTANGLRMVGFEKRNPVLMYNLGCNGIGILPSIWGGKRIADLLNGDRTVSLFDPGFGV